MPRSSDCLVGRYCAVGIRNYRVLGEAVLFRSNFGIELYNANNPDAQVTFHGYVTSHAHAALHPSGNAAAADRLRTIGDRRTAGSVRDAPPTGSKQIRRSLRGLLCSESQSFGFLLPAGVFRASS